MNPESPLPPRRELEASLTALLLGELSAEKAAALREVIDKDFELGRLHDRLKASIEMVREIAATPAEPTAVHPTPLKLSEERRAKLLQQFKTVRPRQFARPKPQRRFKVIELVAVVAILGIVAAILTSITGTTLRSYRISSELSSAAGVPATTLLAEKQKMTGVIRAEQEFNAEEEQRWRKSQRENQKRQQGTFGVPGLETPAPNQGGVRHSGAIALPSVADATAVAEPTAGVSFNTEEPPINLGARLHYFGGGAGGGGGGAGGGDETFSFGIQPQEHSIFSEDTRLLGRQFVAGAPITSPQSASVASSGGTKALDSGGVALGDNLSLNEPRVTNGKGFAFMPAAESASTGQPTEPRKDLTERLTESAGAAPGLAINAAKPPSGPSATFNNRIGSRPAQSSQAPATPAAKELAQIVDDDLDRAARSPAKLAEKNRLAGPIRPEQTLTLSRAATAESAPTEAQAFRRRFGGPAPSGGKADRTTIQLPQETQPPVNAEPGLQTLAMGAADRKKENKQPEANYLDLAGQQVAAVEPQPGATLRADLLSATSDGAKASSDRPVSGDKTVQFYTPNDETKAKPDSEPKAGEAVTELVLRREAEAVGKSRLLVTNGIMVADNLAYNLSPQLGSETFSALQQKLGEQPLASDRFTPSPVGGTNVYSLGVVGYYNVTSPANVPVLLGNQIHATNNAIGLGETEKLEASLKNLEDLQRGKLLLNMKIASEHIDTGMPKTAMVEIMDRAVLLTNNLTTWEKLRGAVTGNVEAKTRVKVDRDISDVAGIAEQRPFSGYDPSFAQTEFETIQSEAVLGKVVDKLNLNQTWAGKDGNGKQLSKDEAAKLLKKKLDLKAVPNTSFLEIKAKASTADEAANLANGVAEAYREFRREQRSSLSRGGVEAIEERLAEQNKKIAAAEAEVRRLQEEQRKNEAEPTTPKRVPAGTAAEPQPEISTADNAFSTFSLNVSDVSFKLAAASLEKGVMPEPATIRSEEFINAFDYRDPEPAAGIPIAFAWERARYPFAQNRDLLRLSLKTGALGRQPGRPLNLVLLLDNSGSMERADRVAIIREALRVLATQLHPEDKLSVISFARTARLWVDGVAGSEAGAVAEKASALAPEGGTNLEEAMNLAYQTAQRHYLASGINRIVLLTDGAANLGNVEPEALKRKVETNRKQGIALDCFGIGWEGYNDDLLEVLSRNGDGRYGFINTPEEAATEFAGKLAGALQVAASDVKVQVEFNPARVAAYRQIGYAKHQLTKEQFRDNTVDAAEIGAAEAGNALYTVEVNPAGRGPLATLRVRFRVPGTGDYREQEWAVPYNGPAVALEQATPAMRLAASSSAFSEWLVSSPFATEVGPDRLLGYLRGVPEVYGADPRPRKLEWMIRQAGSLVGK